MTLFFEECGTYSIDWSSLFCDSRGISNISRRHLAEEEEVEMVMGGGTCLYGQLQ